MSRDCEHGKLARSCDICELTAEIADLKSQLAEMTEHCGIWQDGCHEAERQGAAALERERKYKEALLCVEWGNFEDEQASCPACGSSRASGHYASCEVGKALHAKAEGEHPKPSREQMLAVAEKLRRKEDE